MDFWPQLSWECDPRGKIFSVNDSAMSDIEGEPPNFARQHVRPTGVFRGSNPCHPPVCQMFFIPGISTLQPLWIQQLNLAQRTNLMLTNFRGRPTPFPNKGQDTLKTQIFETSYHIKHIIFSCKYLYTERVAR